ncbi:succinate dehydrogenase, hydrophobic membrane anchor protein [Paracoccus sp. p4-l81]|uniref:succinate dehydrogenase, hydrophobic membrane anchor protein n=1 Tax=unclassified Paracoccus (in: a-proteobacteria) TaxID=2688777 RepID=UPI0035B8F606
MRYLTDRKRAVGLGASGTGTGHQWFMTVTAAALLVLVPLMIFVVGHAIGLPRGQAMVYMGRPFPAIVTGLTLVVGMRHYAKGVKMMLEDYTDGLLREVLVIGATVLGYAVMAAGLYGLIVVSVFSAAASGM